MRTRGGGSRVGIETYRAHGGKRIGLVYQQVFRLKTLTLSIKFKHRFVIFQIKPNTSYDWFIHIIKNQPYLNDILYITI